MGSIPGRVKCHCVGIKGFTCNSGTLTLPLNTSGPVGVAYTDNTQGIYNSVVYVGGFSTSANNAMSLVAGTNPQWYAAYSNTTTGLFAVIIPQADSGAR